MPRPQLSLQSCHGGAGTATVRLKGGHIHSCFSNTSIGAPWQGSGLLQQPVCTWELQRQGSKEAISLKHFTQPFLQHRHWGSLAGVRPAAAARLHLGTARARLMRGHIP